MSVGPTYFGKSAFFFFELLPFVNFDISFLHISFLSWPFLLNYIVHKATHQTRGGLVVKTIYNISAANAEVKGILFFTWQIIIADIRGEILHL
jgi:hypothetical protein